MAHFLCQKESFSRDPEKIFFPGKKLGRTHPPKRSRELWKVFSFSENFFLKKLGPGLKKNANSQIFVSVQIGHDTLDYIELN